MRGLALLALAVVMISFGAPARAANVLDTTCAAGCSVSAALQVDYTVPANGQEYRWDLSSDLGHPAALITLDAPDQTLGILNISNGNGTTHTSLTSANFLWNEVIAPGHTSITVWAAPDFDFCSSNPPTGTVCRLDNQVFGNGTYLHVSGGSPVTVTFTSTPVPEPTTWSLLIGGFLALGWALRRRRFAVLQPL
jgi:hypothetical protein